VVNEDDMSVIQSSVICVQDDNAFLGSQIYGLLLEKKKNPNKLKPKQNPSNPQSCPKIR